MVELNEKALEAGADALAKMYHSEGYDEPFHHMARSAISAYLSALPAPDDGLEVVATAWEFMGQRHIDFAVALDKREIEQGRVTEIEPLVRLSDAQAALQTKDEQIERWRQNSIDTWSAIFAEIERLTRERDVALENYTRAWNERDAQRRRAVAAEQQVQKLTAENERLREAIAPFSSVAEHDIGEDEDDADIFWPISNARYSMAGRLRVGHLRAARAALETQEDGE